MGGPGQQRDRVRVTRALPGLLLAATLALAGCTLSSSATGNPSALPDQASAGTQDPANGQDESPRRASSPALEALDRLPVIAGAELARDYQRSEFGKGWVDTDGNGCNQRDDVLLRDALPDRGLVVVSQGSCDHDVVAGTWLDPYTGRELTFTDLKDQAQAQAIQIDHIVSLSDAWASGAWEWTPQERIAFANDLGNLLAVDGPTNQAKSDQGPPHWLPEVNRCRYVEQYVQVKDTYGLAVSDDAIAGLRRLLQQCP